MKRMYAVMIALGMAVSLLSNAHAGHGNGMGGGCSHCTQEGAQAPALSPAPITEPYRKFQADTIDLRQEMMLRRFAVQRENLSPLPDKAKIAALQSEIREIQSRIMDIRAQSGLSDDKRDGECSQKAGWCDKVGMGDCPKQGMGGCDKQTMGNCDKQWMGGCNKVPCDARK